MKISPQEFRTLLGNKIASVDFIKRDGTHRTLNGRLEVTSHLHGGEDSTAHLPQYVNIYDMQKQAYRKINLNTIQQIRAGGKTYRF